jgi:hypothetical protein
VTNVEFFQGASSLGSFTAAPWRLTLTNLPAGDYSFAARATDNRGAITISAPANVRVSVPSPGFADNFAARNVITGYTNFVIGNSAFYTREAGEPRHASRNGDHSAWLTWTAPASGPCVIDTFDSGFDTVLAVYTNNPPTLQTVTNLVAVAFNDDADSRTVLSRVSFSAEAGISYQIAVDAYAAGQGGGIVLHLSLPNPAPQIVSPPQSQIVDQGANVTFSVTAAGAVPLRYQWLFNGTPVNGATQTTLLRANVSPTAEGNYAVVVTNSSGSVTSPPALLTVRALPVITQQPQQVVTDVGGTAAFNVIATGYAPLAYQWKLGGAAIPGATNPAFTRSNVQFTNGGIYSVTIVNGVGAANSQPAELIVRPQVLSGRLTNSTFRVTYQGTPGRAYALERASALTNWSALTTNTSPVVQGQVNDPAATGTVSRIYRLRVTP